MVHNSQTEEAKTLPEPLMVQPKKSARHQSNGESFNLISLLK